MNITWTHMIVLSHTHGSKSETWTADVAGVCVQIGGDGRRFTATIGYTENIMQFVQADTVEGIKQRVRDELRFWLDCN